MKRVFLPFTGPGLDAGYYTFTDTGQFQLTDAGMAAVAGVSIEQIKAQARLKRGDDAPAAWKAALLRRVKEVETVLGRRVNMVELCDYLAEFEG